METHHDDIYYNNLYIMIKELNHSISKVLSTYQIIQVKNLNYFFLKHNFLYLQVIMIITFINPIMLIKFIYLIVNYSFKFIIIK